MCLLRGEDGGLNDLRMETKKREAAAATLGCVGWLCVGGDRDGWCIWRVPSVDMEFGSREWEPGRLGQRGTGMNSGRAAGGRHTIDVLTDVHVAVSGPT